MWMFVLIVFPFLYGVLYILFPNKKIVAFFEKKIADFKKRSVEAWRSVIKQCRDLRLSSAACIVHGGTIMAVLSEICGGDYYDYHCGNCEGYVCDVDFDGNINTIEKITERIRRNNE